MNADHKQACLDRYHANTEKRRAIAQQVIDGKRQINPDWPMWVQYDIQGEIKLIHKERAQGKKEHARERARHMAEKAAKDASIL